MIASLRGKSRILAHPARLLEVAPFVRAGLRQCHSEAELHQPRDRRRHLYTRQVQTFGLNSQLAELSLHMQKRRKNRGDRLAVNRPEALRGGEPPPDRRFRLSQNRALKPSIPE